MRPSRTFVRIVVVCLLAGAIPGEARAQYREEGGDRILEAGDDPNTADYNVTEALRRRGFRLFALADAAGTGLPSGGNLSQSIDNYSPCDAPLRGFCGYTIRPRRNPSTWSFQHFEILTVAGAPPHEYAKILAVAPSVANAVRSDGWTYIGNAALFRPQYETGPADGSLGSLFSGASSTSDGRCSDFSARVRGNYPPALPLLAVSTCPATWAAGRFGGDRPIPESAWQSLLDEREAAFGFDYWRVADSVKTTDATLGTRFATYGAISDHYTDILGDYGAVMPGGTGDPLWPGYPLGLTWHFEAFSFDGVPGLDNVNFWRATVVNRSADVWGGGIDYDSLYLGFQVGLGASGAGGQDRKSAYFRADLGAAAYHQSRVRVPGPCDDPTRDVPGDRHCSILNPLAVGYGNGATAIVVLKSPIGDLRNKLFTRRPDGAVCQADVDPFCRPSHATRGDTITFNHGHLCGFGGCWASTHNFNDRRAFGMLSTTDANVMEGRDPLSLSSSEAWLTFRSAGYPAVIGEFNKWVPGVQGPPAARWDYNGDGQPDTLFFDTCHVNGCVEQDWDTLPGGQYNTYGNIGGIVSAGPFALAAGDSTAWFVAFIGETDSVPFWNAIEAATMAYLEFFPRAEPAPPPAVRATQTTTGTAADGSHRPTVTLVLDAAATDWTDDYLLRLADAYEAAPAGTLSGETLARNPWLADSLRTVAANNVEALEIYKSCDGGRTFTVTADCRPAPAIAPDGSLLGTGWRTYAAFTPDRAALPFGFPNTFTDSAVTGGREYTYVIVTRTRGVTLNLDTPDGPRVVPFAAQLRSSFRPRNEGPSRVEVYVPVSRQPGYQPATVAVTGRPAASTVRFEPVARSDSVVPGSYVAAFGNRFSVDEIFRDSVRIRTRVTVEEIAVVDSAGVPVTRALVSRTFTRDGPDAVILDFTGIPTTVQLADTVRTVHAAAGYVLTGPSGPVYATGDLDGLTTPRAVAGNPVDPGFDIHTEAATGVLVSRHVIGPAGDTLAADLEERDIVQWQSASMAFPPRQFGRYRIEWTAEPLGGPVPFIASFSDTAATQAAFADRLRRREAGSLGLTGPETLIARPEDLVPVRFPFRVRNESYDRDVALAMYARPRDSILLGSGADTLRIAIPPTEWVPGDRVFFLEEVELDSTTSVGVVLDGNGQPIRLRRRQPTWQNVQLGCALPRAACNPLGGRGASRYVPIPAGGRTEVLYHVGLAPGDEVAMDALGPVTSRDLLRVTESDLARIRVVLNPFVVFSSYQTSFDDPRVVFTNVPPEGVLRIYTVSGQFVQQVTWTPGDLLEAGDLHVALRNRTGELLAPGLFLWVISAPSVRADPTSAPVRARGKFVVIR